MIQRVLFIGWQDTEVRSNAVSAFERSKCVRTHQLFVVERRVQVGPQITAVAARAESGVRSTTGPLRSNADNR
jgi:hypothetical protein